MNYQLRVRGRLVYDSSQLFSHRLRMPRHVLLRFGYGSQAGGRGLFGDTDAADPEPVAQGVPRLVLPGEGSADASYRQAEEPVSQLINDFGPPVASPAAARQRAAMPFVHLERELWDLRDAAGREITSDAPERRGWLLERGAVGRLQAAVKQLLADPGTLAAAVRLLLDRHFTPVLAEPICAAVDLDVPTLDLARSGGTAQAGRLRPRQYSPGLLRDHQLRPVGPLESRTATSPAGCGPLPRSCRSGCYSCSYATRRGTGTGAMSRCWPPVRSTARSRQGAARRPATGQMKGYSGSYPNAPRDRCPRRVSRRTPWRGRWAPRSPG